MKKIVILSLAASLLFLIASSFRYSLSNHPDEGIAHSEYSITPDLNHVVYGPGCDNTVDGNSCYKPTILTLKSDNNNWALVGEPTLEVEGGVTQGSSAQWNHLDRSWQTLIDEKRISVQFNTPTEIRIRLITGSGPIKLRISCKEHTIN